MEGDKLGYVVRGNVYPSRGEHGHLHDGHLIFSAVAPREGSLEGFLDLVGGGGHAEGVE